MIWFAIIWLAVGTVTAILFGLMAHKSQSSTVIPRDNPKSHGNTDPVSNKDHVPAL